MLQSSAKNIGAIEKWILASRPKTLPAAVVPVLVGTSIALHDGKFNTVAALISLAVALLIQIGTNFINDLYDFLSGADKKDRSGPVRVLTSGLISEKEMRFGISLVFGMAFLLGLYLVFTAGWFVLVIGLLSLAAGYAYTAGPFPLAYNGLGDIFVFIFFGFVGTIGTYYVQALEVTWFVFWASVPVGALVTNILVVNNYRDRYEDRHAGKITLAVKFGARFTRLQFVFFIFVSYIIPLMVFATFKERIFVFLPFLSLPLAIKLIKMIYTLEGKKLNKTLELTAKFSALYGFLFALGILL